MHQLILKDVSSFTLLHNLLLKKSKLVLSTFSYRASTTGKVLYNIHSHDTVIALYNNQRILSLEFTFGVNYVSKKSPQRGILVRLLLACLFFVTSSLFPHLHTA